MKRKIIAYCQAGLMNRISCLLNCIEISKRQNRDLYIFWDHIGDPGFQAQFNELFDNEFNFITSEEIKKLENVELYTFARSVEAAKTRYENDELDFIKNKFGICEDISKVVESQSQNVIYHYWTVNESSPYSKDSCINNFYSLKINQSILDKVEDFVNTNKIDKEVIGVHIRATDFNESHGVPYMEYARKLEQLKNEKVFLISDSRNVEEKFSKRYGNIIIRTDKQYPQIIDENFGWIKKNRVNLHLNCEIVADGLVDFLIATRTNFKIYDPRSTYSNLISELSRRNK